MWKGVRFALCFLTIKKWLPSGSHRKIWSKDLVFLGQNFCNRSPFLFFYLGFFSENILSVAFHSLKTNNRIAICTSRVHYYLSLLCSWHSQYSVIASLMFNTPSPTTTDRPSKIRTSHHNLRNLYLPTRPVSELEKAGKFSHFTTVH